MNTQILRTHRPFAAFAALRPSNARDNEPSTPAEIAAGLHSAIDGFQNENNRRFQRIEQSLNAQMRDVGRLTVGGSSPALNADAELRGAVDFYAAVLRRPVDESEVDLATVRDYQQAFVQFIRRGEAISPDVRNALSVGSDTDGGLWAPPAMSMEITTRLFDTSPMRKIASTLSVSTGALELPYDAQDAISGGWVVEKAARPATDTSQAGLQRIETHEQYAFPQVTQTLLDDASFNVEEWLNGKIADKLLRDENTAFVVGNGVGQPRGFLSYAAAATTEDDSARTWGKLQYVVTGQAGGFPKLSGSTADDPGALYDCIAKLKEAYRATASWTMNRSTMNVIRKLKDADGRTLWVDGLREGEQDRLLGYPVVLFEDMPTIDSDTFSIAFGDFKRGYLIVDRMGVRVLRDPFTNKPMVGFYSTKRVGGDVRDFDAIKLMKFATS